MSLKDFLRDIVVLEVNNIDDGLGGFTEEVREVKTVQGNVIRTSNKELKIAEKLTNKSIYSFKVELGTGLDYGDIIRQDEQLFRLTSKPKRPPAKATLNFEQFECEEFVLND